MICTSCKYEWNSRVKEPKSCPMCKRYVKKILFGRVHGSSNIYTPEKFSEEITREPLDE